MTVELNGIAHIQLTVNDPDRCCAFWEKLCHFFEMKTLIKGEGIVYCIGSRTGILVRGTPEGKRDRPFDQDRPGLHHLCFRAREREQIDQIYEFVRGELDAKIIHPPEDGKQFAPGYYSVLFEDPDGIRVEVNYVPGRGHLGKGGRLGEGGAGPSTGLGRG
jgi:catechol 2,3-dioxygenase-like lactoylglutathione lyase family enzyme